MRFTYCTAVQHRSAPWTSPQGPKCYVLIQKTHRRVGHRGGLAALRSVVSLSRDDPTRRRTVAATTDAGTDLDPMAHGTPSIIQRGERKSIHAGMVWDGHNLILDGANSCPPQKRAAFAKPTTNQAGRPCRGRSVPCFPGRNGHLHGVSFGAAIISSIKRATSSPAGRARARATPLPAHKERNPLSPSFPAAIRIARVKIFWRG